MISQPIKYSIWCFIWVFLCPLTAVVAQEGNQKVHEEAVEVLVAFLSPQVKTLNRSIHTYRYFSSQYVPHLSNQSTEQDLKKDLKERIFRTKQFYSQFNSDGYVSGNGEVALTPPGAYLAIDPVASAEYGGESWAMFEIQLPRGFRYLQAGVQLEYGTGNTPVRALDYAFNQEVKVNLVKAGCYAQQTSLLFLLPENSACSKIVADVAIRLKLDAILYPFAKAYSNLCHQQPASALLLLDENILVRSSVRFFNSESDQFSEKQEDVTRLQKIIELADVDHANFNLAKSRRWKKTKSDFENGAEWIKNNIFSCNPAYPDEYNFDKLTPITFN